MQEQMAEKDRLRSFEVSLDTKRLFIRCVCHEVRSPLSTVLSGIYILEDLLQDDEDEVVNTIADIKLSCQSANDIMKALLLYEQLESKTMKVTTTPQEIQKFVEQNVMCFAAAARQGDVTLTLEKMDDDEIFVNCSPDEFGFALRALVDNAIKFAPPMTHVNVKLYTPSDEDNDDTSQGSTQWVRFKVTDMGPGLTADGVATLFKNIERFTPTDNNTDQGGGDRPASRASGGRLAGA
jgi:signal transduction histidine kinase